MVQRFPKLQRIDQGLTVSILLIQLIQPPTCEQECGNPFAVVAHADCAQFPTLAQKKCASKDIRSFKAVFDQKITPFFLKKIITQFGKYI